MKLLLLLAVAAAVLVTVSDAHKVKRQLAQSNCNPELLKKLSKCCQMPQLFTNDIMAGCSGGKIRNIFASLKNAAKITGRRVAEASTKISGSLGSIKNFTSNITGEISNAAKMMSGRGPFCYFECMFKNRSMLASDGKVDTVAASAAFIAAAPDAWKSAMQIATTNCSAILNNVYAGMNTTSMPAPPPGMSLCKPCSTFFTGCIEQQMILNCPAFKAGGTCASDLAQLKSCSAGGLLGMA